MREKIRNELDVSYWVEAWSKPLVRQLDGPRNAFEFEVTAYFRDVRQLRFYNLGAVARIALEEYREVRLREARFRVRPLMLEPAEQ